MQAHEFGVGLVHELRLHHVVEPPVHADHRIVLDEDVVGAGLGEAAAGEPDDQDATFERDALRRPVVRVTTDRVVDHVGATTVGELLHRVDEVTGAVVDHDFRAEIPAHLHLLRATGRRDDPRTGGEPQLDRGRTDTARAGMDEQRLAGLQVRPPMERDMTGLVRHVERRRGGVTERVGYREHHRLRRDRPLGEPTVTERGDRDHASAERRRVHAVAEADHRPADFGPGRERQRRLHLVLAAAHQDVGEVQRRRGHLHEHLVVAWHRLVDVVESQHRLRLPQLVHSPCLHPPERTQVGGVGELCPAVAEDARRFKSQRDPASTLFHLSKWSPPH